jgi:hypothetical protein
LIFKFEKGTNMTVQKGWKIRITGVVDSISKVDVDKSGRNPNIMVYVQLGIEALDDAGAGVVLDSPIRLRGREAQILKQLGRPLESGDRIVVQSSGVGNRPPALFIDEVKFAA